LISLRFIKKCLTFGLIWIPCSCHGTLHLSMLASVLQWQIVMRTVCSESEIQHVCVARLWYVSAFIQSFCTLTGMDNYNRYVSDFYKNWLYFKELLQFITMGSRNYKWLTRWFMVYHCPYSQNITSKFHPSHFCKSFVLNNVCVVSKSNSMHVPIRHMSYNYQTYLFIYVYLVILSDAQTP
jgi:hypothetical protein